MSMRTRGRKPLKLTWNIKKHSSCTYMLGQGIESSRFVIESFGSISWCLVFYPKGYKNPNYIACFLQRCDGSHTRKVAVDLEMCLKAENGAENFLKTISNLSFKNGDSLGFPEFVTLEELERCPYPNGTVILQCYVSPNTESNYVADLTSLSSNMNLLFDERTFYDVIVRVGKTEFKIHKTLLNARAPAMVNLIEQSAYEASIPFITVSDFSPVIVKEALYFIYTGNLTANCLFYVKLRNFALKYKVESLLRELTKSSADDCLLSAEINIESMSHTLHLISLISDIGHKKMIFFPLSVDVHGGKIILQYFVSKTMDDLNINVEISLFSNCTQKYFLLLNFKGYLMCEDQAIGECCDYTNTVNCAESVNIRFSHLIKKNALPLNVGDYTRSLCMLCNLNLSDSPESTGTTSRIPSDTLSCLSNDLFSLYTNNVDTDLVLVTTVDGVAFRVHKAIICARVPSIMAMFKGDTLAVNGYVHNDLKNLEVEIPAIHSNLFKDILEYIYSGKLDKSSVKQILRLQPDSIPIYMKTLQENNLEYLNLIKRKKRKKENKFLKQR